MTELQIFYTKGSQGSVQIVKNILDRTYNIKASEIHELEILENYYNPDKKQYDASLLLKHLLRIKNPGLAMWIVDKDVYVEGMNFVFGYSSFGNGAVLSIKKLDSTSMIEKEAVHEIGHAIGLEHCVNFCAMQFSNSVPDAKMKPTTICSWCKEKLNYPNAF